MKPYNVNVRISGAFTYQVVADTELDAFEAAETLMEAEIQFGDNSPEFEVVERETLPDGAGYDGPYNAEDVSNAEEKGLSYVYDKLIRREE